MKSTNLGIIIAKKRKRIKMNLDKTAKALKKINRLYEIINDIGEASSTEKDLLRAYAKELYESLSDDTLDEQIAKDIKKQKKEEKKLKKEKEKAAKVAVTEKMAPEETTPEPVAAPMASSATDSKVAAPTALGGFSPAMQELFELNPANELSDKLSQSPISDLTKAMGINERIFTVNELFGGNQDEFQNLMSALNGLGSYDEAKAVLMKSAASKYDWDIPKNQKKARTFVKLIQRRYK